MNRQQIQKLVDIANDLIKSAIDSDGDKISVVDKSGTWQEPMEYDPIRYSNGRLIIAYREPYSGNKRTVDTVSVANMELDGIPQLRDIIKMYKAAMKKEKNNGAKLKTPFTYNESKINVLKHTLTEARDNKYVVYTQIKDKVIAKVSGQKASTFTAIAKQWTELDSMITDFTNKKRDLNDLKNAIEAQEAPLKAKLKEKIEDIYDDSEKSMSLVVECLNSSFSLSKITDANLPSTKTTQSTDYEKVVNLLLEQLPDLKSQIENLTKQCTAIQTVDVKGKERSLRVNVGESIILEGTFDKILQWFTNLKSKFLQIFDRSKFRQKKINSLLTKMSTANENKISKKALKNMIQKIISEEISKK